jgi:hypothetical protein
VVVSDVYTEALEFGLLLPGNMISRNWYPCLFVLPEPLLLMYLYVPRQLHQIRSPLLVKEGACCCCLLLLSLTAPLFFHRV